jgi:pyrimidine deaminase RibD-like protein
VSDDIVGRALGQLPQNEDYGLWRLIVNEDDRKFMEMAVAQAREQLERYGLDEGGERPDPKVGCVVVTKDGKVDAGYRGEIEPGEHAEFTVLEKKMGNERLAGATVYTTLEPCTDRKPPKKSCADRLIERQIARVVIGILDPDDRGQGYNKLMDASIAVELFPKDLVGEIRELNRSFLDSRKRAKSNRDAPTGTVTPVAKSSFAETASTSSQAFFSRPDQVLAQVGEPYDRISFTIKHGSAFYLRIIPGVELSRPLAAGDLLSKIQTVEAFGSNFGGVTRTNDYGVIFLQPIGLGPEIGSLSQAFRNGELWGINIDILGRGGSKNPPLIYSRLIEAHLYRSIRRYAAFLLSIGRSEPHTRLKRELSA